MSKSYDIKNKHLRNLTSIFLLFSTNLRTLVYLHIIADTDSYIVRKRVLISVVVPQYLSFFQQSPENKVGMKEYAGQPQHPV